jgi:hypothetical protein
MVAMRGVDDAIDTYTAALDGIVDSAEEGDVALEAYKVRLRASMLDGRQEGGCCSLLLVPRVASCLPSGRQCAALPSRCLPQPPPICLNLPAAVFQSPLPAQTSRSVLLPRSVLLAARGRWRVDEE